MGTDTYAAMKDGGHEREEKCRFRGYIESVPASRKEESNKLIFPSEFSEVEQRAQHGLSTHKSNAAYPISQPELEYLARGHGPSTQNQLCPSAPSDLEHIVSGHGTSNLPHAAFATELSGTPRSPPPSNSKASRSTPSTVPHIGSPVSRRESPGMPDLAVPGRCEGHVSIFDGAKLKGCLFEPEPVCFNGGNADFVHVDECELPNQVQMLTPTPCASLMESFVLMPTEMSADNSTVSFNLSPIKRRLSKAEKEVVSSVPDTQTNSRREQALDRENQENLANVIPQSESKVAAMCSLWEQKLGAASAVVVARGATGMRGRSSSTSARALPHEKVRSRGASAEACLQKLTVQQEKTKRATHRMNEVLRELRFARTPNDPKSPLSESTISENSDSSAAEHAQDSPTTKLLQGFTQNSKNMWRSTRLVTKTLITVLKDEACGTNLSNAIDGLKREVLTDAVETPALATLSQLQAEIIHDQPVLDEKELLAATKLTPTLGMEVKSDSTSRLESLHASALTQPEEEADGPLPVGMNFQTLIPRKSKRSEDSERAVVEGSRQSTISDMEPAREPQPLESPRHNAVAELSLSSSTPLLESPREAGSLSPARPSVSGPEHEEFVTTEAESSMESSGSGDPLEEDGQDEDLMDFSHIQPCEDGMERQTTMLHHLEQSELRREIHIIVPEGMGEDRKVTFTFEDKVHEIVVPEGYEVRQQVLVTLSSRPFLERTAALASRRGHHSQDFPDRWYIIDNLRHSLRTDKENSKLDNHEFKYRYQLYLMLRGKSATPLLSILHEDVALE